MWQQFQSIIHEKLQKSVLNAKTNAIITSIYSIVKVNGFTYIYTYTFNPTPGGRRREVGGWVNLPGAFFPERSFEEG